jgi:hypothetical protein
MEAEPPLPHENTDAPYMYASARILAALSIADGSIDSRARVISRL